MKRVESRRLLLALAPAGVLVALILSAPSPASRPPDCKLWQAKVDAQTSPALPLQMESIASGEPKMIWIGEPPQSSEATRWESAIFSAWLEPRASAGKRCLFVEISRDHQRTLDTSVYGEWKPEKLAEKIAQDLQQVYPRLNVDEKKMDLRGLATLITEARLAGVAVYATDLPFDDQLTADTRTPWFVQGRRDHIRAAVTSQFASGNCDRALSINGQMNLLGRTKDGAVRPLSETPELKDAKVIFLQPDGGAEAMLETDQCLVMLPDADAAPVIVKGPFKAEGTLDPMHADRLRSSLRELEPIVYSESTVILSGRLR